MSDKKFESVALSAVDKELREMEPPIRRRDPETTPRPVSTLPPRDYVELERILKLAFDQAASGKGHKRHAFTPTGIMTPWDQQPILANARQVGPGGPAQQVMKKAGESVTMAGNKNFEGAKAEALGAIVYAAALYKLYEEMEAAKRYD